MKRNIILSLFDYTGNWSRPYRENGYEVIQVDIQHGTDILTWNYKEIERESLRRTRCRAVYGLCYIGSPPLCEKGRRRHYRAE